LVLHALGNESLRKTKHQRGESEKLTSSEKKLKYKENKGKTITIWKVQLIDEDLKMEMKRNLEFKCMLFEDLKIFSKIER